MNMFDHIDFPKTSFAQEKILQLRDALSDARAKRRTLNLKIENLMYAIRELELKVDALGATEDQLLDELDRSKI